MNDATDDLCIAPSADGAWLCTYDKGHSGEHSFDTIADPDVPGRVDSDQRAAGQAAVGKSTGGDARDTGGGARIPPQHGQPATPGHVDSDAPKKSG